MTTNKNDNQLLKEYVQEVLLNEYNGSMPRLTLGDLRDIGSKAAVGAQAVKGKFLQLVQKLKHGAKVTLGQLAQLLTGGLFTADFDKIHRDHMKAMQGIQDKYGSAFKEVDDKFKSNTSPAMTMLWLAYPASMAKLAIAKGVSKEVAAKMEEVSLQAGASANFQKEFNRYFQKAESDIEAAKAPKTSKDKSVKSLDQIQKELQDQRDVIVREMSKVTETVPETKAIANKLVGRYDTLLNKITKG